MQLTTMSKTTKFAKPQSFYFRFRGPAHNISISDTPHHVARDRLALVKSGTIQLPDATAATLCHFLKTGQTTPPAPKPVATKPKPAAAKPEQWSVQAALDWALNRPKLGEKSARAAEEQESDHARHLRRSVNRFAEVIDLTGRLEIRFLRPSVDVS